MRFVNRRAQYPGRVKLVPVPGSDNLYDLTYAEGSVSGSYAEGTPLNADTFNALQEEIRNAIESARINSIQISDGTNKGEKVTIGTGRDIIVKLPATIKATLRGKADTAQAAETFSTNCGSVTTKTVYLTTSYQTVYKAKTHSAIVILIAPYSNEARNTAVFAASWSKTLGEVDDMNYINYDSGRSNTLKRWVNGEFQVAMGETGAQGTYAITIIDAHD